jgi:hypothetical protein
MAAVFPTELSTIETAQFNTNNATKYVPKFSADSATIRTAYISTYYATFNSTDSSANVPAFAPAHSTTVDKSQLAAFSCAHQAAEFTAE